jgi:E3 ubiquitin-protein ligase NEDD4
VVSKFTINYVTLYGDGMNYIRAHTCFNRIDLPDYQSKEELEKTITFIIDNEIMGFGIE